MCYLCSNMIKYHRCFAPKPNQINVDCVRNDRTQAFVGEGMQVGYQGCMTK